MNCNSCSEVIRSGENFCRICGHLVAMSPERQSDPLGILGHYALGFLIFGSFTALLVFLSYDFIRLTPFGRFLILALAGGIALGSAIHFYSKNRRLSSGRGMNRDPDAKSTPDLLTPGTPVSFISVPDAIAAVTTSELKVPKAVK